MGRVIGKQGRIAKAIRVVMRAAATATTRKSWSKSTKQKGRKPFFVYPKKPEDTMKHQFLEAGRIVRTHGVRGELVLECWADSQSLWPG